MSQGTGDHFEEAYADIDAEPTTNAAATWRSAVFAAFVFVLWVRYGTARTIGIAADALTVIFGIYLVRHLLFLGAALSPRLRRTVRGKGSDSFLPSVTVLLPCHNEELVVADLVAAVAGLDYPRDRFQAIFIDDKSSDATGEILQREIARHQGLYVIRRGPETTGGKSGGLNAALAYATGQILIVFDGDHSPQPDAIRKIVAHFAEPNVGAVQGRCIVENPFETRLSRLVAIDYLCGYLVNMVGRQAVFDLPAYGGANCAIRSDLLRSLGGWNEDSVTEDTDITLQALLRGWRVKFEPEAIDVEQGVTSVRRFWKQRYRWARGHQQVCRDYRRAVIRTRYLSLAEKIETMLFLYVFHVPALCVVALGLILSRSVVNIDVEQGFDLWPLVPLMFAGPMLELGAGLVAAGVRRVRVLDLLLFPMLYVISMGLCTKALLEAYLGRSYSWQKTARSQRPADGVWSPELTA